MKVSATIKDNRIVFTAPPTARDLLLSIPGCTFRAKAKEWSAPLAWSTAMAARGTFGEGLEISDELDEWGHSERQRIAGIEFATEYGMGIDGLRGYQHEGSKFLYQSERAILADEPGTGKTIQAIAALDNAGRALALPALVICPNTVLENWRVELAKWAPELTVRVVHGTKPQRLKALGPGADVYVIGWGSAKLHTRIAGYGSIKLSDEDKRPKELNAIGFRTVILDEAHRAKNPESAQTRAAWALSWGLS